MQIPGYLSVKEAAERYGVSRAKIYRLIKAGRLRTSKAPRDERVTLLREDELDAQFQSTIDETVKSHKNHAPPIRSKPGLVTPDWRATFDALRERMPTEKRFKDTVEIIRQQREERASQLDRAASSEEDDPNGSRL